MKRHITIELLVITLIGLLYVAFCAPQPLFVDQSRFALDLQPASRILVDDTIRPVGIEHERLSGVILPFRIGLQRYGYLPAWNPYLSNGVPLINNAFNYLFNPFHSLPVLLLGGVAGSKFAILIALLLAGYNMWILGYTIGFGAVARVTIGALYMVTGSLTAKFGAGHFQLACSLAWVPLVIASMWWTMRSQRRGAPVAFGVSFALLFYAGNIYYTLHTLLCCLVIIGLHLIGRQANGWQFHRDRFLRACLAAGFAFGLAALQFFPVWQTRDYVTHEQQEIGDGDALIGSYDLAQATANLTLPWYAWADQRLPTMFEAVDYAYVGQLVPALIGLAIIVVLAASLFRKNTLPVDKRLLVAALVLAVFMMLWAGGQTQPIPWLYRQIPLLAQFRYLGRALAIAALWWIVLSGLALDLLWKTTRDYALNPVLNLTTHHKRLMLSACISLLVWLFMLSYSSSPPGARIAMLLRNVGLWQVMDTLRYSTLPGALSSLISIYIAINILDTILLTGQHLFRRINNTANPVARPIINHVLRIGLLTLVAIGILDTATANIPALRFAEADPSYSPIYDSIHLNDTNRPFPGLSLPFSPLTYDAYENELRIWSLNEGWLPAASKPILPLTQFFNPPRWLIVERNADGTIHDPRVQGFIETNRYQRRACYARRDTITLIDNCALPVAGDDLYELPDALPYAFITTEQELSANPDTLRANQITPATILLYQPDKITLSVPALGSGPRLLVLQEANFPGWQVMVDEQPVQPLTIPTSYVGKQTLGLLAVPLGSGSHTVTAAFTPPGFTAGIFGFVLTLSIAAFYLTRPKQKSPA